MNVFARRLSAGVAVFLALATIGSDARACAIAGAMYKTFEAKPRPDVAGFVTVKIKVMRLLNEYEGYPCKLAAMVQPYCAKVRILSSSNGRYVGDEVVSLAPTSCVTYGFTRSAIVFVQGELMDGAAFGAPTDQILFLRSFGEDGSILSAYEKYRLQLLLHSHSPSRQ